MLLQQYWKPYWKPHSTHYSSHYIMGWDKTEWDRISQGNTVSWDLLRIYYSVKQSHLIRYHTSNDMVYKALISCHSMIWNPTPISQTTPYLSGHYISRLRYQPKFEKIIRDKNLFCTSIGSFYVIKCYVSNRSEFHTYRHTKGIHPEPHRVRIRGIKDIYTILYSL